MDIKNLLAFIEVSDKRSFSRSAESLKVSQPAVSKRIAALELELSAKLFDRVGRRVFLTEAGDLLLPHARNVFAEICSIKDALNNLDQEISGKLSIGTCPHVGVYHLAPVLKHLRNSYPGIQLDINFDNTVNTIAAVKNSQLELALCAMHGPAPKGLQEIEVWSENLLIVVAPGHPLATNSNIDVALLMKFVAILCNGPSVSRMIIDQALAAHAVRVSEVLGASDLESMKMMISIGLGWGCLPEKLVDDSLVVLEIPHLKLSQRISLIKNQDRTLSRVSQLFVDQLLDAGNLHRHSVQPAMLASEPG